MTTTNEIERLTPEQVATWKRVFPQFASYTDEQIERLRIDMQTRADKLIALYKTLGVEING